MAPADVHETIARVMNEERLTGRSWTQIAKHIVDDVLPSLGYTRSLPLLTTADEVAMLPESIALVDSTGRLGTMRGRGRVLWHEDIETMPRTTVRLPARVVWAGETIEKETPR